VYLAQFRKVGFFGNVRVKVYLNAGYSYVRAKSPLERYKQCQVTFMFKKKIGTLHVHAISISPTCLIPSNLAKPSQHLRNLLPHPLFPLIPLEQHLDHILMRLPARLTQNLLLARQPNPRVRILPVINLTDQRQFRILGCEEGVDVALEDRVEVVGRPLWTLFCAVDEARGDAFDEIGVGHECRCDVVFFLEGLCDGPLAADAHLLEGYGDGNWGAGLDRFNGFLGPCLDVFGGGRGFGDGLERGHYGGDVRLVGVEDGVDCFAKGAGDLGGGGGQAGAEFFDGGVDDLEALVEGHVVWKLELGEARFELLERGRVDVVGCYAVVEGVDALELLRGEREIGAECALHAGEEEGGADVGEEANGSFGHGEERVLGCDAEGRVYREADAAAHCDAVHEGDVGLRVGRDQVVELVFQAKVVGAPLLSLRALLVPFGQLGNVSAGAKGASVALHDYNAGHV
jgi:hypothetical protein